MPTLAHTRDGSIDRLGIAAAHIEAAIAHINNVMQVRVPAPGENDEDFTRLRLLVTALADIRTALVGPGTHER